ncbi:MAG TPA: hypothetical protein VJ932_03770 [Alkalispirochaeta sp.]|nr:hypothetical protein [Alkalispirochaeta sp.]
MRSSRRSRAVPFLIATSLLVLLFGCATSAPIQEERSESQSGGEAASQPTAPRHSQTESQEEEGNAAILAGNASVFLDGGLSEELEPVIVRGAVAAGWYYPLNGENEAVPGAMGLYASGQALVLAHRSVSVVDEPSATRVTPLLPRSADRRVRALEPIELQVGSGRPAGFRIRFSENNRDEEVFIIWTGTGDDPPHTVRLPISAVRRTALRDLTHDGVREMVHLSVAFDAMGSREIMVDALSWADTRFVHIGSVPLIHTLNRELTQLESRLKTENGADWKAAADLALQPIEDSPPVAPLLPAREVRIPRITELSLDLSRGSWEFTHDIAVHGNIYRLLIRLEANPVAEQPVQIDGIQGR